MFEIQINNEFCAFQSKLNFLAPVFLYSITRPLSVLDNNFVLLVFKLSKYAKYSSSSHASLRFGLPFCPKTIVKG